MQTPDDVRGGTFTFEALPQNLAQLQQMPGAQLSSPFETAALCVAVLCRYGEDVPSTLEMLNYLKGPQPLSTYDTQFLRDRLAGREYIPRSYFAGATPQNNYAPQLPYRVEVSANPYTYAQEGYARVLLRSGGADSPRPLVLRRKGDQWFLWENGLLADMRRPAASDPWA